MRGFGGVSADPGCGCVFEAVAVSVSRHGRWSHIKCVVGVSGSGRGGAGVIDAGVVWCMRVRGWRLCVAIF